MGLPLDPLAIPEGRREGVFAVETLAIFAPTVFDHVDGEACYMILRAYFSAGWCVRDILHAIDHRPDGSAHYGGGTVWKPGDSRDRTLVSIQSRLREWRWGSDASNAGGVMTGGYTAMAQAMTARAEAQRVDQTARRAQWDQEAEYTRTAEARGASAGARRAAAVAAALGRRARLAAEARALARTAAEIAQGRAASAAWPERLNGLVPERPAGDQVDT